MAGGAVGYVAALVASVFFGSNYVPVKKYKTGDGIAFQWSLCCGVMFIGLVTTFMVDNVVLHPYGLIGGSLWALGNLLVVPIVELIGLGLGFLLWSAGNLLMGFAVGRFGLFGVHAEVVVNPGFSIAGVMVALCALSAFIMIKPELKDNHASDGFTTIQADPSSVPSGIDSVDGALLEPNKQSDDKLFAFLDKLSPQMRRIVGLSSAFFIGCLYGVNLVPFTLWTQDQIAAGYTPGVFDFVLSQFTGIFIFSTAAFLLYAALRTPEVYPRATAPAFVSGAMWAIASVAWMIATAELGFTVGYPIVVIGPNFVSSIWSVVVFREITGKWNLRYLGLAFVLLMAAVFFFVLSKVG